MHLKLLVLNAGHSYGRFLEKNKPFDVDTVPESIERARESKHVTSVVIVFQIADTILFCGLVSTVWHTADNIENLPVPGQSLSKTVCLLNPVIAEKVHLP